MFHCLAKNLSFAVSNDEYSKTNLSCNQSSYHSIFIDPNIPNSERAPCDLRYYLPFINFIKYIMLKNTLMNRWIDDGECDDACRTAECLFDAGDCQLGMYNCILY